MIIGVVIGVVINVNDVLSESYTPGTASVGVGFEKLSPLSLISDGNRKWNSSRPTVVAQSSTVLT